MFESLFNIVLVLLGFGLVIVIHELGHFLAARWAGVRVFAFAVGFGPAVCSWRKGLGFRMGSSEDDYRRAITGEESGAPAAGRHAMSPTEYRLNYIPFGGYVRMLGQEDANPGATSAAPDSYTSVPVWKRMVIISAGVVMNIILAAVLFVIVFMAGMREVAPIIGAVGAGTPAAAAGLREGDVIRSIDGHPAVSFSDLQIATAMAGRGESVRLEVDREGERVELAVSPVEGGTMRIMQIGVAPARSRTLFTRPARPSERRFAEEEMAKIGFAGVPYGAVLESIEGTAIHETDRSDGVATLTPLHDAAKHSLGREITLGFRGPSGQLVTVPFKPEPEYARAIAQIDGREPVQATHVVGLMPLMKADAVQDAGKASGLVAGDVFAKVGDHEYPDIATAITAIRAKAGSTIPMTVLRAGGEGGETRVNIIANVSKEGTIGFTIREATETPRVANVTAAWRDGAGSAGDAIKPLSVPGGATITRVGETPITSFAELRTAMKAAAGPKESAAVRSPTSVAFIAAGESAERSVPVEFSAEQVESLASASWVVPDQIDAVFQPASLIVKASGPVDALMMGVAKTKRVLVMTYLTFLRLFQGTVKVEHLKGPVGIIDLGSRFAEEGLVYVLFFLGLISANLAVVNFLPLPIVDGGLFLMLCYEGIARKPVPMRVQNAVTLAGLALIGTMFVIVTFNDIMNVTW
ncbi:MAG: site-2 protease family protein [Phycisphaerales bacterium]